MKIGDKEEVWKDIVGLEGRYKVSNLGNVYSVKNNLIMKPYKSKRGYYTVNIPKENRKIKVCTIHRFVANAFIPNPENKREVNHIDGNKLNNRVENLEWVTPKENNNHARRTGLRKSDGDIPVIQYDLEGNFIARYKSYSEASRVTGIKRCNIGNVASKRLTRHGKPFKTAGGFKWENERERI